MTATIGALIFEAEEALRAAEVPTARLDARILLRAATGLSDAVILADPMRPVSARHARHFKTCIARRSAREPVARIVGEREFWSLPFQLSPQTLEPRADTETLVAWALELGPADAARIWDVGTGSGCILLALLHDRPGWRGIGSDISAEAVRTARRNAQNLGLADRARFFCGDWDHAVGGGAGLDLIVANPPYIRAGDIEALSPEVRRFDPINALTDHKNGLSAYGRLARIANAHLKAGGWLIVEHGRGQETEIVDIFRKNGLQLIGLRADLAGVNRCVAAKV